MAKEKLIFATENPYYNRGYNDWLRGESICPYDSDTHQYYWLQGYKQADLDCDQIPPAIQQAIDPYCNWTPEPPEPGSNLNWNARWNP